jgi:hypothetical protein
MKTHLRSSLWLILTVLVGGCGLQKRAEPTTVLKTEDFISDATTLPTDTGPASPTTVSITAPPPITAAAASEGILNVTAVPGAPIGGGRSRPRGRAGGLD